VSRLYWLSLVALSFAGGLAIVLALAAAPTMPRSLQLTGYSGNLAEWSLAATLVSDETSGGFNGALTMEHTGLCSLGGPERRTGEMRLRVARFGSTMSARMLIDGIECTYDGTLSDVYTGMLLCPGTRPVPLTVWIK
jgi:hypothetical protein